MPSHLLYQKLKTNLGSQMTILKSSLTNSPGVRSETEGWRSPALVPMASDGIALALAAVQYQRRVLTAGGGRWRQQRIDSQLYVILSTHIFFRRPRDDVAFDHSLQADVISYEPPRLVSEMGNIKQYKCTSIPISRAAATYSYTDTLSKVKFFKVHMYKLLIISITSE